MQIATKTTKWAPRIGGFSKSLPGGISLNFAESGGANCSPDCQALKAGVCYAVSTEKMKPSIRVSGERKRLAGFEACCNHYRQQISALVAKGTAIPWIRFSSFGSVPNRELTAREEIAFVRLVRAFPENVPVHFPVESKAKAERFRGIIRDYELSIVVRESAQSDDRMAEGMANGEAMSRIVFKGRNKRERLATAQAMSKGNPDMGVCPAIASTILNRPVKIKCGQGKGGCTMCSQPGRVVLYPQHN